jgi:hypothetical protein
LGRLWAQDSVIQPLYGGFVATSLIYIRVGNSSDSRRPTALWRPLGALLPHSVLGWTPRCIHLVTIVRSPCFQRWLSNSARLVDESIRSLRSADIFHPVWILNHKPAAARTERNRDNTAKGVLHPPCLSPPASRIRLPYCRDRDLSSIPPISVLGCCLPVFNVIRASFAVAPDTPVVPVCGGAVLSAWPAALAVGLIAARRFAFGAIAVALVARFVFLQGVWPQGAVWSFPAVADSLAAGCLLALYQFKLAKYRSVFTWRGFPLEKQTR